MRLAPLWPMKMKSRFSLGFFALVYCVSAAVMIATGHPGDAIGLTIAAALIYLVVKR